jgi:hypothetical protein
MLRKILLITLILACGTAAPAQTAQGYLDTARPLLFSGTLSGIRQANDLFEQALQDTACPDCPGNRELLFLHVCSQLLTGVIRDNGDPVDSVFEWLKSYGIETDYDNCILALENLDPQLYEFYTAFPENRYGQPEQAEILRIAANVAAYMEATGMQSLDTMIDELERITETPADPFRMNIQPGEMAAFYDIDHTPPTEPIEVDFGEVLMLRGILYITRGMIAAQSAYDTKVDDQDRLLEKIYEDSFSVEHDLLMPHPDFLKLLQTTNDPADGTAIMAQSRQDILAGLHYYLDMMDYLWNEDVPAGTDPQEDELIAMNPDDRYLWDAVREKNNAVIASLENDTAVTFNGKQTRLYELTNMSGQTLYIRVEITPFGKYEDGEIEISTDTYSNWYDEVEVEIIGTQINGYADNFYGDYGYFTGTLSGDQMTITNASFEYWGYDEGNIVGLTGSVAWENQEEQWTADLNPIFGDSPRYATPISPRDYLPQFSNWNKPRPNTLPDPTLGGILPDAAETDWIGWIDPQPDTIIPVWPQIQSWQKVNGFVGAWLTDQLIVDDATDELGEGWIPEGTDIQSLYMGYDDMYLHGGLLLTDPLSEYSEYRYEISLSYCPVMETADTLILQLAGIAGSLYGELWILSDEFGYEQWQWLDSVDILENGPMLTFRIPFDSIPTIISGRYVSVSSSVGYGWEMDEIDQNRTHVQIGTAGSISGTVTFPGHRGGPIFVQAYADPDDAPETLITYTVLNQPGNFTLDRIGLGFNGYIRAFSPLFGQYNLADMEAFKVETVKAFTLNTQTLGGIQLNLQVPPVLENGVWIDNEINTTDNRDDYYAFDAVQSSTYQLEINRYGNCYAEVLLLDRNGIRNDEIQTLYDWQTQLSWTCPVSGRYYIRVTGPQWMPSGGSYQLRVTSDRTLPVGDISGAQWSGVKDGEVNLNDLSLLATHWLDNCAMPYWCDESDFNQSGTVDLADLPTLLDEWIQP